ncbi:MAG: hypothetical protein ACFFBP_06205 [Promethearchaeota archaeon]
MNPNEFAQKLIEVQELMKDENYEEAIIILEKLKLIDQKGDFDYNLTHKLYQLISNSHSLYNQQVIVNEINSMMIKKKVITINELNQLISERTHLSLDDKEFKKEVELLILRGLLTGYIEGDLLIF